MFYLVTIFYDEGIKTGEFRYNTPLDDVYKHFKIPDEYWLAQDGRVYLDKHTLCQFDHHVFTLCKVKYEKKVF